MSMRHILRVKFSASSSRNPSSSARMTSGLVCAETLRMINSIMPDSSAPRYSVTFFFTQGRSFFSMMLCSCTLCQSISYRKAFALSVGTCWMSRRISSSRSLTSWAGGPSRRVSGLCFRGWPRESSSSGSLKRLLTGVGPGPDLCGIFSMLLLLCISICTDISSLAAAASCCFFCSASRSFLSSSFFLSISSCCFLSSSSLILRSSSRFCRFSASTASFSLRRLSSSSFFFRCSSSSFASFSSSYSFCSATLSALSFSISRAWSRARSSR
mmetsp:Transcript_102034/g.271511  ORF Transcript_102034/g.271511 Transcript_102034/m.271511 type:complete len:270 (-) Transcript_102034:1377-2186(-)